MKRLSRIAYELLGLLGLGLFATVVVFVFSVQRESLQPASYPGPLPSPTTIPSEPAYPAPPPQPTPILPVPTPTQASSKARDFVFYLPPNGERIVYLASSPETVDSDLLIPVDELEAKGVTLVYNFDDLRNMFDNKAIAPQAVILHKSRLNEVDKDWIQKVYPTGIVMAGVNVSVHELAAIVGDERAFQDPNWPDGGIEPFWSVLYYKAEGSPEEQQKARAAGWLLGSWGQTANRIRDSIDLDTFLSVIRRDIAGTK